MYINGLLGENRNKNVNYLIAYLMAEGACQADIFLHIAGKLI